MKEYNYYSMLNVMRDCSASDIKKAYRRMVLIHHPDKGGEHGDFHELQHAFEVLNDASKRATYDRELKRYGHSDGNSVKTDLQRSNSDVDQAGMQRKNFQRRNTTGAIEIPSNLNALSVKELKELVTQLGMKHDDCFEKADLVARVQEYKTGGGVNRSDSRRQTSTNSGRGSSTNVRNQARHNSQSTSSSSSSSAAPKKGKEAAKYVNVKILSVGDYEVGKSCLIKRYCEGRFVQRYIATIGVDYGVKKLNLKGQKLAVNFFDLSGHPEFDAIRADFYKDSQGVLMVFDLDNRESFLNLANWEKEMKKNGLNPQTVKITVCGNKSDLKSREVESKEVQKWCKSRSYDYFETSAESGSKVSEVFENLFAKVITRFNEDKRGLGL
eukprot:CAMPEP_0115005294 /NCGR_PEP_ID=MMETSP0216-20121206/19769_1 /TAXON_ID=223996 /ORGANISM="Protocruzia adherens, Strain Boccale" /LENGTH=382 /DNA_ID=CAMNT_0002371559 /DNA_START=77 /DNA_END=1225 /DNA_ORIENTATION=-